MRKIFNYDALDQSKIVKKLSDPNQTYPNTISSGGCLFYKKTQSKLEGHDMLSVLLISYSDPHWNRLDDFGGQVDPSDQSIYQTIIRETREESNGLIKLEEKTLTSARTFYNKSTKYYSVVIPVDPDFYPETKVFGEHETTDQIRRQIQWYPYQEVIEKLSMRLVSNKALLDFLTSEAGMQKESRPTTTKKSLPLML